MYKMDPPGSTRTLALVLALIGILLIGQIQAQNRPSLRPPPPPFECPVCICPEELQPPLPPTITPQTPPTRLPTIPPQTPATPPTTLAQIPVTLPPATSQTPPTTPPKIPPNTPSQTPPLIPPNTPTQTPSTSPSKTPPDTSPVSPLVRPPTTPQLSPLTSPPENSPQTQPPRPPSSQPPLPPPRTSPPPPPNRPPPGPPRSICPRNAAQLRTCSNILRFFGNFLDFRLAQPCCNIISDLSATEANACLCDLVRARVQRSALPPNIILLCKACGRRIPRDFTCP